MVAPGSSGPTTAVSSGLDENATPAASLAAPLRPGATTHYCAMFKYRQTHLKLPAAHPKEFVRIISSSKPKKKLLTLAAILLLVSLILIARRGNDSPRVWNATEIPVAFWSWQNETPDNSDIQQAIDQAGAQSLFLRAGQIDYETGRPKRIRAVRGEMPRRLELHLVYNATRGLLFRFEHIDPDELASAIYETFAEDCARAERDGARVVGLQLDIDSPTRLLKHYARVLSAVRDRLPQQMKLSVTGLPTWMESRALKEMLLETDFWVPQFYGAQIPEKLDQWIPISSAELVARDVKRARRLGHPFYAGLAAYGYAILYTVDGSLISLRGDIDPARVAHDPNLYLANRRPLLLPGEWCYTYRVKRDTVINGLNMREGDLLMLDLPFAHSLRATVRAVRQEADELLIGLCIFRLPALDDSTNLTIREVADALADRHGNYSFEARAVRQSGKASEVDHHQVTLSITNSGSISLQENESLMQTEIRVPDESLSEVSLDGFDQYSPMFLISKPGIEDWCAIRRANTLRLRVRWLRPGETVRAIIEFAKPPPDELPIRITVKVVNKAEIHVEEKIVKIESENEK